MKKTLLIILVFILMLGCTKGEELDLDQIKGISYSIEEVKDVSYGNVKRYSLGVTIPQEVNIKQLEVISKIIVRDFKKKKSFNALVIGFYDYKEYIGNGYTLGSTEYAPKGDYGKASTVKTGKYNSMTYNFNLKNKDWNRKLTQDEVKIYGVWNNYLFNTNLSEDKIKIKVAHKFNIDIKEVNRIIDKQNSWTW